jgi:2-polyprenyl-3-methyl-5-hydroxy-6-metoxy-1,4-benzoquinol methylase
MALIMNDFFTNPSVLEIGAGNGLTSFLLKCQGYDVNISDYSKETCSYITQHYSIPTISGLFEDMRGMFTYDFIFASHVIEHSHQPHKFFKNIFGHLLEDGLFYFDTPNAMHGLTEGPDWKHFNTRSPYEHVIIFSKTSLELLAHIHQFNILSMKMNHTYQSIECLFQKANG